MKSQSNIKPNKEQLARLNEAVLNDKTIKSLYAQLTMLRSVSPMAMNINVREIVMDPHVASEIARVEFLIEERRALILKFWPWN